MKVAINCIYYTAKGGGITEYIKNLLREIALINVEHEFILYVIPQSAEDIRTLTQGKAKIKIFPYDPHKKIYRALLQNRFWKKEESIEKFDIFHSPFFHAPQLKSAKIILTVHDLRFLRYPKSYTLMRYIYLNYSVQNSVKRADLIISISNFTKSEIIDAYHYEPSKIKVIHEAVNEVDFSLSKNASNLYINQNNIKSQKFILAVGHLEPRKNYINLIKAYQCLPDDIRQKYRLIIVGKRNHDYKNILQLITQTNNVLYLDFVSREELVWLYANCKIHCFPSYYEGFGFPSLEAGIFSKLTAGANCSSIPEITGDGGIYFDPFSINEITETIKQVLTDEKLQTELAKNSRKNIERFSWRENAIKTLKVYNLFKND